MSERLDARQLDQLWDASVRGYPLPFPIGDPEDRRLFELLGSTERPAPNPQFAWELGQRFIVDPLGSEHIKRLHSAPRLPPLAESTRKRSTAPLMLGSRLWSFAVPVLALLLIVTAVVLLTSANGDDAEQSIPAAFDHIVAGESTSTGTQHSLLFSHTWATGDLKGYALEQWGWLAFGDGVVPPGGRSQEVIVDGQPAIATTPGISLIHVTSGELSARLAQSAWLAQVDSSDLISVDTADITIGAGATLIFGTDALTELWNPTGDEVRFTAVGAYAGPDHSIDFFEPGSDDTSAGIAFDPEHFVESASIDVSMERIVIEPGAMFAYAIGSNALQMIGVTGDGLQQRTWTGGQADGAAQPLFPGMHAHQQDGSGYAALTNTGLEPVDVQIFTITPGEVPQFNASPAAA